MDGVLGILHLDCQALCNLKYISDLLIFEPMV